MQEAGWHNVSNGSVRSLPNNGHGDCLFRAISHQLQGEMLAIDLRQAAVNHMQAHMQEFMPQLLSLGWDMMESGEVPAGVIDYDLPEVVLQVLRLPWTWGGAESIAAISQLLGRRIIVYRENSDSIHFAPPNEEGQGPPLRLLHRQGHDGRRTHYESVLQWQPAPGIQVDRQVVSDVPNKEPCHDGATDGSPPPAPMKLRPRKPRDCGDYFQRSTFSDAEDVNENVGAPIRQHIACKVCDTRIGRYALLCGFYLLCGQCVRQWFIENINNCLHCRQPVHGWFKVFPQN